MASSCGSETAISLRDIVTLSPSPSEIIPEGPTSKGVAHLLRLRPHRCALSLLDAARDWQNQLPGDYGGSLGKVGRYSPPTQLLEPPANILPDSRVPYAEYEYESHVPFHLHPAIRKLLLIRQCRRLHINSWEVFELQKVYNEDIQEALDDFWLSRTDAFLEPDYAFYHQSWMADPLFFSVTHLSFGEKLMTEYEESFEFSFDGPAEVQFMPFSSALEHVCLRLGDSVYDAQEDSDRGSLLIDLGGFDSPMYRLFPATSIFPSFFSMSVALGKTRYWSILQRCSGDGLQSSSASSGPTMCECCENFEKEYLNAKMSGDLAC
ncbi:hypothetical protein IAR50_005791 [Cryptococcus sp. DSM 104548]